MSAEKLLSVIVPSYNMEAYLAKNISSMMVQDEALRQLVEVIVVNDGSKDRTSEIAHDFAEKYPGCVTVIDKPNGHYGSCINAALPVAKGKYIRVLDADDYADKEVFERFLSFLSNVANEDELDLIISNYCNVDPDGKITAQTKYNLPKDASFTLNSIAERFTDFVSLHAITYRTEMLREMGYHQTEGCPYTDTEWFILPMSRVRQVRYFEEILICYLVGRDGQTMQPEIYLRDFPIVIKLVAGIIQKLNKLRQNAVKESIRYFEFLILRKSKTVYSTVLLSKARNRLCETLNEYDLILKDADFSLYQAMETLRAPTSRFAFSFVTEWRKNQFTSRIKFVLYDLYVGIVSKK